MWAELDAEQQTPLVDIRRSLRQFEIPQPFASKWMSLPFTFLHPDVMQVNTRKKLCERQNASRSDIHLRVCGNKMHDDGRKVQ